MDGGGMDLALGSFPYPEWTKSKLEVTGSASSSCGKGYGLHCPVVVVIVIKTW